MSATITIDPGGANETVLEAGRIERADATKIHTGVSDWDATVAFNTDLKDRKGDAVHIEDARSGFFFRGFLTLVETTETAGDAYTDISGLGIEHDLERNATEKPYTNILVADAISDYWSTETSFSATVTAPSADDTTTDESVQEADTDAEFEAITSTIGDTDPLAAQNTNLELLQTLFFSEGENFDRDSGGGLSTINDYSNDEAWRVASSGDWIEWDFTTTHDIPENQVGVAIREDNEDGAGSYDCDYFLDGELIDTLNFDAAFTWDQVGDGELSGDGWTGGTLEAGTHTVRVENNASSWVDIDCVALYDKGTDSRFTANYNFDNTVDSNGYLSGPELYPESAEIELDTAATTWNVTEATFTGTFDDTSGAQRIRMRLPPGGSYGPTDGTEDNTSSVTFGFGSDAGSAVQAKVRLGRYGTRTTATPTTGFNGQELQSMELTIGGDDRPAITDSTYEGSDMAILQDLHREGRMRFWVAHADGSKNVTSEPVGNTVEAKPDWTVISTTRRDDIKGAYNHVTVRGARDSDGNRLKVTVSDSASISANGQEHWDELAPDADTQVEVERIARQVLKQKLQEFDVSAEREIVSTDLEAGPAYPVTLPDGTEEDIPSEEVRYTVAPGDVTGRVVFDLEANRLEIQQSGVESDLRTTQLSF